MEFPGTNESGNIVNHLEKGSSGDDKENENFGRNQKNSDILYDIINGIVEFSELIKYLLSLKQKGHIY